eukprot:jgi/Mesen1/10646/ME000896S10103
MSASLASACSLTSIISLESRRLRTGSLGTSAVECPTSLGSISLNSSNELLKNGIFLEATSSTRRVPLSIVGRAGGSRPTYKPRPKPSSKGRGANQEERNDGPLMNEAIRVPQVRLLGADQVMVGVVTRDEALAKAREASLDLVMIAPDAEPPVVRIMDYSTRSRVSGSFSSARKISCRLSVSWRVIVRMVRLDELMSAGRRSDGFEKHCCLWMGREEGREDESGGGGKGGGVPWKCFALLKRL